MVSVNKNNQLGSQRADEFRKGSNYRDDYDKDVMMTMTMTIVKKTLDDYHLPPLDLIS